MKKAILLLSLSLIFPHLAPAADAGSDVAERYSYTMGVRLGQLLRAQGISQLDSASFAQAIDDVLNERTLRLSTDEMRQAIVDQQRLLAEQRAAKAADNLRAGQ